MLEKVWRKGNPLTLFVGMQTSMGFPDGSEVKASACHLGDLGSISGQEDPLEKEMATHSSVLAWRIPWTAEPGGLLSMGSHRVGLSSSSSINFQGDFISPKGF